MYEQNGKKEKENLERNQKEILELKRTVTEKSSKRDSKADLCRQKNHQT